MRALASAMRRPFWLPAPGWAIRLLLGRAGNELLLSSQRVRPAALESDGFVFTAPTVDRAIAKAIA
jgi:NAD dependent epimerase/dehydratase family enzyme